MKKVFSFVFVVGLIFLAQNNLNAAPADHLVINEIFIDGVIGTGGSYDDWIELYNPGATSVDLSSWSIQKQSSASTSAISKISLSGVVPSGGYLLLVRNNDQTALSLKEKADILLPSSFTLAPGNVVYLVNDDNTIDNKEDGNIVDFVGMGEAESFEGLSSAQDPPETKSISRVPDGEDSDENGSDFQIFDTSTPTNSESGSDSTGDQGDLSGSVLLTLTHEGVANITSNSAQISFQVNGESRVQINYGLNDQYGSSTASYAVLANTVDSITLNGLSCDTEYHYSIFAENLNVTESDFSEDDVFSTLPCGIEINSLSMTKSSARANNDFADGWEWNFDLTIWDFSEQNLKMKFDQWSGLATIDSALNMQFSVDAGLTWVAINQNGEYPATGADISGIDDSMDVGRQVSVVVRMKLPVGTMAGNYVSSYGILTEQ